MRKVNVLLSLVLLLALAAPALATCPNLNGPFSTLAGTLLAGRVSEAWCTGAGPGVPGNMENAESWDGAALGTQWKLWGMTINSAGAILVSQRVLGSYMYVDYVTDYDGGEFWLSRNYAWSDGTGDLTGIITSYHVTTTVTLYNGVPVGQTSNVTLTGQFTNCPDYQGCVIEFAIANAMKVWDSTSALPMPADYPPLLCSATTGELFTACCIDMSIHCVVAADPESWSGIKSMYR
ncbi:MAG: hypothetical protein ACYDIE_02715 [Candidatus Krumholzibacteriia bacterium]